MSLTFVRDPQVTPELHEELARLWYDVSRAGGSVGFVPSVTEEEVRAATERQLGRVTSGEYRMLGAYDARGRLSGTTFLRLHTDFKMRHWSMVLGVMIDPGLQRGGHGLRLMRETIDMARDAGLEALRLEVRGGMGLEGFYGRLGFKEVGRVPGGLRLSADDYRDDILMWLALD
ncbi:MULTISPECIES: GNAT family N-acetyltransferase [Streptomyces]|uniref:GNAT family N-acetyltransferase n=1 Tax=Streptomyces TaxID=1883 RepID=UPI00163C7B57|nr:MULTISPECIES: GNAT family N-acetyltransferase [Streptomyces]MBC2877320.1 GNAT family N-acetyltransferase [Streptomyces sp. TYQ1024]UBI38129.1 GNAT family N-acetyltransferase [Streptomyces mobaraensis]UKW30715.1 GNAT family N-acetyltransferase [Streptomyces sp. TYQ1024]